MVVHVYVDATHLLQEVPLSCPIAVEHVVSMHQVATHVHLQQRIQNENGEMSMRLQVNVTLKTSYFVHHI